jgi:hypothetical protein
METMVMETADAEQVAAYELGKELSARCKELGLPGHRHPATVILHWCDDSRIAAKYDHRLVEFGDLAVFLNAGIAGADMPIWTYGWRYGDLPESGRSYNYRDQFAEYGVSMMSVVGSESMPDGTFALFNARGRKRVWAMGWLVTHRKGSDGEAMLVDAVRIKRPVGAKIR